jgi:predicted nuclease of predicted toxin-antitoxin system
MLKFYRNENFDLQVIEHLQNLGYDVLTARAAGKSNQRIPDEEVLEFAISETRAVLTFNRKDFFRLHKANARHFGIIADADYEALAGRIHQAIHDNEPLEGKLIRVYRPNP